MRQLTKNLKCYHQSTTTYDEFEDEKGKTFYEDFEVCNECNMVIFQGKEMGLSK